MKRFLLIFITLGFVLSTDLTRRSGSSDTTTDLITNIVSNFTKIEAQITKRKASLSPLFTNRVESSRGIFNALKENYNSMNNPNNPDKIDPIITQTLNKQLKSIERETALWTSFLDTADATDPGTRKVRFDTQLNYNSTCGWNVCWDSAGRDAVNYSPQNCYNSYSTTLPRSKNPAEEIGVGFYVATYFDPNNAEEKQKKDFTISLSMPKDKVEEIPLAVLYKIKKAKCK